MLRQKHVAPTISLFAFLAALIWIDTNESAFADDAKKSDLTSTKSDEKKDVEKQAVEADEDPNKVQAYDFKLDVEVEKYLVPLIESIRDADLSRVTVEMLADSVMSGQVVSSQESLFQIAAKKPGKFTVYLKEPEQRTRVYCDGKKMLVAMAPDAFFKSKEILSIQDTVTSLPVPMGPYPEPLLALSMAGADPSVSLIAGMKSIKVIDKKPFKGKIPAVHLRGVQADSVVWDLWVTDKKPIQPLRMLIDLTPMLAASEQVHVPEGFSQQVRYDFVTWRVTGTVDDHLFQFQPAKNAVEYKSMEHYFESMAGATGYHPTLGKKAPAFLAKTFGKTPFDSRTLKGRVVVLDFWATWCPPCLKSLPVIKKVADEFKKEGVVFIGINTGEEADDVRKFLSEKRLPIDVVMDPDGAIADGFVVDSIPQTVVIGKDGLVESVHLGYADEEALIERLTDELEILTKGGRIGSLKQGSSPAGSAKKSTQKASESKAEKMPRRRPEKK